MPNVTAQYRRGELTLTEYATKMATGRNMYSLMSEIGKKRFTAEELNEFIALLNGQLQTREERRYIIQVLANNFQSGDESYRAMFLEQMYPHTAILATMADLYTFKENDFEMIWKSGAGKRILKRSQRKLRDYINMLKHFTEYIDSKDLEFGVFMTLQMMKPNLVCIMLNDHGHKLTKEQKERLEAAAMALNMMGTGLSKLSDNTWTYNQWG